MTFQRKMYIVFWLSMAVIAAATVLKILDEERFGMAAWWLMILAILPFVSGITTFLGEYFNLWVADGVDAALPQRQRKPRRRRKCCRSRTREG